ARHRVCTRWRAVRLDTLDECASMIAPQRVQSGWLAACLPPSVTRRGKGEPMRGVLVFPDWQGQSRMCGLNLLSFREGAGSTPYADRAIDDRGGTGGGGHLDSRARGVLGAAGATRAADGGSGRGGARDQPPLRSEAQEANGNRARPRGRTWRFALYRHR